MKSIDNVLREEIINLNTSRPHWFTKEVWVEVKLINLQIAKLCKDFFMKIADITWIGFSIKSNLDFIADFSNNAEIWEVSRWVKELLEFYKASAVNREFYETARNINELYNLLLPELQFPI